MAQSAKERQANLRTRLKAKGFRQITIWVSKSTSKKIEKLMKAENLNKSDAIDKLINEK